MENKKQKKTISKVIAAALCMLGLLVAFSAKQMNPVIFALAALSALAGWGYLLFSLNKDLSNGLPQMGRIAGLFLLAFGVIVAVSEVLAGFAYPGYTYWTIPPEMPKWVGAVATSVAVAIIGVGILFREKLGKWFYE